MGVKKEKRKKPFLRYSWKPFFSASSLAFKSYVLLLQELIFSDSPHSAKPSLQLPAANELLGWPGRRACAEHQRGVQGACPVEEMKPSSPGSAPGVGSNAQGTDLCPQLAETCLFFSSHQVAGSAGYNKLGF